MRRLLILFSLACFLVAGNRPEAAPSHRRNPSKRIATAFTLQPWEMTTGNGGRPIAGTFDPTVPYYAFSPAFYKRVNPI